jgi:hypothetical protein
MDTNNMLLAGLLHAKNPSPHLPQCADALVCPAAARVGQAGYLSLVLLRDQLHAAQRREQHTLQPHTATQQVQHQEKHGPLVVQILGEKATYVAKGSWEKLLVLLFC